MYCKNCGNKMELNDNFCSACNTPVGAGTSFCQQCGNQVLPTSVHCGICGINLSTPIGNRGQNYAMNNINDNKKGYAIASFVLGIVGLLSWCTLIFPIILGVVGVIFGFMGLKSPTSKGLAIAGIVMSILACSAFLFTIVIMVAGGMQYTIFEEFSQYSSTFLR